MGMAAYHADRRGRTSSWFTLAKPLYIIRGIHFLQRVSIACYAERCISHSKSVRLSDRPSVTRWH